MNQSFKHQSFKSRLKSFLYGFTLFALCARIHGDVMLTDSESDRYGSGLLWAILNGDGEEMAIAIQWIVGLEVSRDTTVSQSSITTWTK